MTLQFETTHLLSRSNSMGSIYRLTDRCPDDCRSHRLNEYSSRGHCIMTLQFETTPLLSRGNSTGSRPGSVTPDGLPVKKYGKLVLVDLAGSERLKVCGRNVVVPLAYICVLTRAVVSHVSLNCAWRQLVSSNVSHFAPRL